MEQKIVPCLWFDTQSEEAISFYTNIFRDGKVISIQRYPDEPLRDFMADSAGRVLTAVFELAGYRLMALDGGPQFHFTPALSFYVECENEAEIEGLWEVLSADGTALMPLGNYGFSPRFGWVQDKYGVSWQLNVTGAPQSIAPFFTFVDEMQGQAEEAVGFYTGLFGDAHITEINYYDDQTPGARPSTVQYARFELEGQPFHVSDAFDEHGFTFSGAFSFQVECKDQAEVDRLWDALSVVPEAEACGWCKDRYGVSWQIIPTALISYLEYNDEAAYRRVMDAMLDMKKIDIAELDKAYAG